MALRLKARGTTRRSTVRSTRTLLSFAVAAGLTVQATTAVAAPSDASDPADSGSGDSNATAESFLADLVGEVSSTEGAVASMENELGGLRESVNKARVDLDRAQREAQEAQDNVTDARGRLDSSNSDVEEAQEQLDEIARSAYARGGDAAPVNLAAGGDIAADSLDRATYLRLASEKQQSEIDRLDLVRTQTANEESSLREFRDTADGMVGQARDAHAAAEEAFSSAQSSIAEKSGELEDLRSDLAAAEARLKAAKSAVDRVSANAGASSFDKRRAAENAADRAEARLEGQDDTADQLVEPKVEEVEIPEGAEGMEGTESAEAPEGAEAPADVEAPAEQDLGEEGPAEQDLGEEGPAESAPAEEDPAVHDEQPAGDPGLSEGSGAEGSAGGEEGEPVDPGAIESSFSADPEGDERRQAAIDGLVGAAGAAAFAGINAHLGGNPDGAVDAAINAAQGAAGESWENLPSGGEDGIVPSLPTPGGSEPAAPDSSGSREEKIERVIERGMGVIGTPYSWGGGNQDGPTLGVRDGGVADTHGDYAKVGFDCSGLMVYAFAAVGIQLEKYSGYQYSSGGTQVPAGEAQRGDMIFWGPGGTQHVALYLGDGQMLEAPNSGDVVKISPVRWDGMEPMAVRPIE